MTKPPFRLCGACLRSWRPPYTRGWGAAEDGSWRCPACYVREVNERATERSERAMERGERAREQSERAMEQREHARSQRERSQRLRLR